jgi:hypothetical protein
MFLGIAQDGSEPLQPAALYQRLLSLIPAVWPLWSWASGEAETPRDNLRRVDLSSTLYLLFGAKIRQRFTERPLKIKPACHR